MSTRMSAGRVRATYEFITAHRYQYSVQAMCWALEVAARGYHDWVRSRPAEWCTSRES